MSWFLIAQAPLFGDVGDRLDQLAVQTGTRLESPRPELRFLGRGPADTFHEWKIADQGGCVAGLGFEMGSDHFFSAGEWQAAFGELNRPPQLQTYDIQGHWAMARWAPGRLEVAVDVFGMRPLYHWIAPGGGHIFCTRLDVLCSLMEAPRLNLAEVGPAWSWGANLMPGSGIHGIERLGPGARWIVQGGTMEREVYPFRETRVLQIPAGKVFRDICWPALASGDTSAGLSGGLDSRLLAAELHAIGGQWNAHSNGDPEELDVKTGHRIAQLLGRQWKRLSPSGWTEERLEKALLEVFRYGGFHFKASTVDHLSVFKSLLRHNTVLDGGFGEIARRQLFKRLRWMGLRRFTRSSPEELVKHLHSDPIKLTLFPADIRRQMTDARTGQLADALEAYPPERREFGRWLDLWSVMVKLPNLYGMEQARLDALGVAYKPFTQPAFIAAVLHLDEALLNRGRWHRREIRKFAPELTKIGFVKGQSMYPFWMDDPERTILQKIRKRLRPSPAGRHRETFLRAAESVLRRWLTEAESLELYDLSRLSAACNAFYERGDKRSVELLDWWLAFEAWRREMGATL